MAPPKRLCVRLLSGKVVYEGCAPCSLARLRDAVAAAMGCEWKNELVFCNEGVLLDCIEDAGEEITAVCDQVMGRLEAFMQHAYKSELPEHFWPVRAHRNLMLAAVRRNGIALRHASPELQADRGVVLAAVATNGCALQHASPELRADRVVVLAALACSGLALKYASPELRADRAVVVAALACSGLALQYASPELRADRAMVMAAVARNGYALMHASPELRADPAVVITALAASEREHLLSNPR